MRPKVCIVSGVTLDGKMSTGPNVSSKATLPLPLGVRTYLHSLRSNFDAISVGCNTVKTDNPFLTVEYVEGESPIRVIPCSKADVSPYSHVFREPHKAVLVTTEEAPIEKIKAFEDRGIRVIVAGKKNVDIEKMLRALADIGIKSLMVEGGSRLNGELMSRGLFDELILIHHPIVVGLKEAPSLAEVELPILQRFNLKDTRTIENYLVTQWIPADNIAYK